MKVHTVRSRQSGSTLIEVLISLFILLVGLLGLTGLMVQSQNSQMESYQRVQALSLAQDMASRINANSAAAYCYKALLETASPSGFIGTGDGWTPPTACPVPPVTAPVTPAATATQQAKVLKDLAEWRALLLGAAEKDSGGTQVGAVLGARGCVTLAAGQTTEYQISVAWQGGSETYAPPATLACGTGRYGADTQRRAVGLTLHATNLS